MIKKKLYIHCSDSPYIHHGRDVIDDWHTNERGFNEIGYHWVGEKYGSYQGVQYGGIKIGRDKNKNGAHCYGQNKHWGYCLCGMSGKFQAQQLKDLTAFIKENKDDISEIRRHSDYDKKKPHCCGLSDHYMEYLNGMLK